MKLEDINDKCFNCKYFWPNNDTENECMGSKEACHEFVEVRK